MNKDYYFFWRGPFSQWAKSPFEEFNTTFSCCEQFMMAAKAKLFNDEETYNQIMNTKSPKQHQALGRKVQGFEKDVWDNVARDYVTLGNYNKFTQNEDFFRLLYENKHRYFVEASPYDKIWGVGLAENNPLILNEENWRGTNWLGECINRTITLIVEERFDKVDSLRERLDWNTME